MTQRMLSRLPLVAAAVLLAACGESNRDLLSPEGPQEETAAPSFARSAIGGAGSYLVISRETRLMEGFESKIEKLGGIVTRAIPEIGVAAVAFDKAPPAVLQSVVGARAVLPNIEVEWVTPPSRSHLVALETVGDPPTSGDDDFYFDLQWGADAIDAPQAWNSGARGSGVRVAILDSGIDKDHPDLVPNINTDLSASFVDGQPYYNPPGFYFNHGTHVAGIVAAADNAFGMIGIAPEAELVVVKVLDPDTGSGGFDAILAGVVYAAQVDADVMNMSLEATFSRRGEVFNQDGEKVAEIPAWTIAEFAVAVARATNFAHQLGTTIVTSAGNAATNGNADKDRIHLPSDAPNVISVAATGPMNWASNPPEADLDRPASYTNYGKSVISFAAPGGDFAYPGNELCFGPVVVVPCWIFDMVFSTIPGGWSWAAGTSMAAPHVTGVAALIIGQNGGDMKPAQVESALRRSADDVGKPGNDDFYGRGRVNAYNAVN